MGIYLSYGSYRHADSEASVSISSRTAETDTGIPYEDTFTWNISGILFGDNTADVARKLRILESAYSVNFQDLVLHSGSTICHELRNAGSINGVRVTMKPAYPVGTGAELSTFRNYQIQVEASYPSLGSNATIKQWNETVRFSGGGPRIDFADLQYGRPVRFVQKAQTTYRAWQSGSAVGYRSEPPVSPQLWPYALIQDPEFAFTAPRLQRGTLVDYGVSWSYVFASATPLVGRPRPQPFL